MRVAVAILAASILLFVWANDYSGRLELHDSALERCDAGTALAKEQVRLLRVEVDAGREVATDPLQSNTTRVAAGERADAGARALAKWEIRAELDCDKAHPRPNPVKIRNG